MKMGLSRTLGMAKVAEDTMRDLRARLTTLTTDKLRE